MSTEEEKLIAMLKSYRLKGPSPELEERVVCSSRQAPNHRRWIRWSAAAAGIIAVLSMGLIYQINFSTEKSEPDAVQLAQFEVDLTRKWHAISLLESADLLARQPGGEEFARDSYGYIVEMFSDTEEGEVAQLRLQSLPERSDKQ